MSISEPDELDGPAEGDVEVFRTGSSYEVKKATEILATKDKPWVAKMRRRVARVITVSLAVFIVVWLAMAFKALFLE